MSQYIDGNFKEASEIIDNLLSRRLDDRTKRKINKVLLLLLLGEFYGIHTLNSLLSNYGVSSNDYQKLWSNVSCKMIVSLMNDWLWEIFGEEFKKRVQQSGSTISRQKLTMSIDASIFKQWLTDENFGQYFAKYYSGQYGCGVCGFNVLLCGMSIGDMFYPLHFQLRKKAEKDVEVALKILARVRGRLSRLAESVGTRLPCLYLSVDSGFKSQQIVNYCHSTGIIYIGVPTNSHIVLFEGKSMNIKGLKELYLKEEGLFKENNADKNEPFTMRIRVYYRMLKREVTLFFFRLKGSKKVSVIFSNDINIKGKTLRRHWFERTKIELLFRMIKNDFKIQQITVTNRLGFMKKLAFALVKSVYAQLFTQIVKKTNPKLRRLGFEGTRKRLIFHQIGREYLDELMKSETFCKQN